jgi:ArsR family metal-binding transcriptional regulator
MASVSDLSSQSSDTSKIPVSSEGALNLKGATTSKAGSKVKSSSGGGSGAAQQITEEEIYEAELAEEILTEEQKEEEIKREAEAAAAGKTTSVSPMQVVSNLPSSSIGQTTQAAGAAGSAQGQNKTTKVQPIRKSRPRRIGGISA